MTIDLAKIVDEVGELAANAPTVRCSLINTHRLLSERNGRWETYWAEATSGGTWGDGFATSLAGSGDAFHRARGEAVERLVFFLHHHGLMTLSAPPAGRVQALPVDPSTSGYAVAPDATEAAERACREVLERALSLEGFYMRDLGVPMRLDCPQIDGTALRWYLRDDGLLTCVATTDEAALPKLMATSAIVAVSTPSAESAEVLHCLEEVVQVHSWIRGDAFPQTDRPATAAVMGPAGRAAFWRDVPEQTIAEVLESLDGGSTSPLREIRVVLSDLVRCDVDGASWWCARAWSQDAPHSLQCSSSERWYSSRLAAPHPFVPHPFL